LDEIQAVADDIAHYLARKAGVSDVQPPVVPPKPVSRSRLPFARPHAARASFEIQFTFKGRHRVFRYFIEHFDDLVAVKNTLRVHTNGELMVQVPDGFGNLQTNDMYYGNRSVAASTLGAVVPASR
jgi:hypothetical protein